MSPARSQQSYRHEAFFWRDPAEFIAQMVPFVEGGLADDEPVMLALIPEHENWLRDGLGRDADKVLFVDMVQLGGNPARIIPAWQEFLDANAGRRRPARGIGEPIWVGRRPEELLECQLHEALLNVAIEPELPFWLVCPYDATGLTAEVVEEAHRSHPVILEEGVYAGSARYRGRDHVDTMFGAELANLNEPRLTAPFTPHTVGRLGGYIKLELYVAGLNLDRAGELALAVQRLAEDSVQRQADHGEVRLWVQSHALVCEVADDSQVGDPLVGRRTPYEEAHDGLWLANQVCDLVQTRSTATGTVVRVYSWK
jgi:hypothetical protein